MEEEHPGRGSKLYEGHEVETYLAVSVKSEEAKVNWMVWAEGERDRKCSQRGDWEQVLKRKQFEFNVLFCFLFIDIQLVDNVVLVYNKVILFQILSPYRLLQDIEYSSCAIQSVFVGYLFYT